MVYSATASNNQSVVFGLASNFPTASPGDGTFTIGFNTSDNPGAGLDCPNATGPETALEIDANSKVVKSTSSRKFKRDIRDLSDTTVEEMLNLRPVSFSYLNDPSERDNHGLIAEECEDIMNSIVTRDLSGLPYSIRYTSLIAPLLKKGTVVG